MFNEVSPLMLFAFLLSLLALGLVAVHGLGCELIRYYFKQRLQFLKNLESEGTKEISD